MEDSVGERARALRADPDFMASFRAFVEMRMRPGADLGFFLDSLYGEFASDVPGHREALRLVLLGELRDQNATARARERERYLQAHLREVAEEAAVGIGEAVYDAGLGTIEELVREQPERLDELARRLSDRWGVTLSRASVMSLAGWP